MNQFQKRGVVLAIPTFLIVLVIAIGLWSLQQPTANADSPPPDVPAFAGEPFSAVFPHPELLDREVTAVASTAAEWTVVLDDNFENGINGLTWLNISNGTSGEVKWGTRTVPNTLNPNSVNSAWGVGGGQVGGALDPNTDGYPPNVISWLISGPYDVSDVIDAELNFSYSYEADPGDLFGVGVSTDGINFNGLQANNGGGGGWAATGYNIGSHLNNDKLWISFTFISDGTGSSKPGVFLDDVQLRFRSSVKSHLPYIVFGASPTPSPTPTASPTPVSSDYRDSFTDTIVPWDARRWGNGASYNLIHRSDSDASYSGFLELTVTGQSNYVLVSPLAAARPIPYNIQTRAIPKDPKDGHAYSIIFGGDWNGSTCPALDFSSCFNTYYEFRVEYFNNNDNPYFLTKLKRIEGHDSNNQNFGPDLFEEVKVKKSGWVKWDITVHADGRICIAADKQPIENCVSDSTLLNQPYFGLMVRNGGNSGARVKFDYYQVDWPDGISAMYESVPTIRYTEETLPPSTSD